MIVLCCYSILSMCSVFVFFFNDTATTEIYTYLHTLSLHDAPPISATMAPEIRRLAEKFLMNPKEVSVAPPASPAETVAQHVVRCSIKDKRAALRAIIERETAAGETVESALIFCNRKRDIGVLHKSLQRHGYDAVQLHGDMSQPARMETLQRLKKRDARP